MIEQTVRSSSEDCDQVETSDPSAGLWRAFFIGVGCAAVLAISLVFCTWIAAGTSPAERAATALVMPIGTLWLLLFAGTISSLVRRRRLMAAMFASVWLAVGLSFNGHVAGLFSQMMEHPAESDPAASLKSPLDAVVLLGGYASINRFGVGELKSDGQRLMLAAQLWHSGRARTVICTGTGISGRSDPSEIGREMLVSVGVPGDVIFEVPGVNTAAEMRSLKEFFRDPPVLWTETIGRRAIGAGQNILPDNDPGRSNPNSIGLVTSAIHMPRALRLAATRDLKFTPLASNFGGSSEGRFTPSDLIPSAGAGRKFSAVLKEWLAHRVGR